MTSMGKGGLCREIVGEFQKVGRELGRLGLISSHSGNLSVRFGEGILITRRGAMLAALEEGDLVEVPLGGEDPAASRELPVHQAIYMGTDAKAILHCHPPWAVALSLKLSEIVPLDAEGRHILGRVPVISVQQSIGSQEVAEVLPAYLKESRIAVIRGHGSFAIGETLEESLMRSSALEASARILILAKVLQL